MFQKIISFIVLSFTLFAFPVFSYASNFPNDAITVRVANDTGTDNVFKSVLPAGIYTILNITLNTKDTRTNILYCGTETLFAQRTSTYIDLPTSYFCQDNVNASLDRTSTLTLTYVPYNLSLVPTNATFTFDGSELVIVTNGPNFQEWLFVAGVFLFFLSYMAWGVIYKPSNDLIK